MEGGGGREMEGDWAEVGRWGRGRKWERGARVGAGNGEWKVRMEKRGVEEGE